MTGFFALLRLQLLSRYSDLKPKNWKNQDPKARRRSIGMACTYAFVILYLGGMMFFVETKAADLLLSMGEPPFGMMDLMVIFAVATSIVGTLILAFFSVMSTLYLSRDSVFLASLPLKPRTVLAAKMTQIWLAEVGVNALILLPACILYGIKTGMDALFYIRMVVVWLVGPLMPVCIGALLATLLTRASTLLRHREAIMTVGGLALMVASIYFCMNLGGMAGNSAGDNELLTAFIMTNAGRIQGFTAIFPPAGWAVRGLLGDGGQLALFAGASLASIALLIAVLGIWYRQLSLLQAEAPVPAGKKGIRKGAFARTGGAFTALLRRELRQILRVPAYATNILPVCLMPALMVVMMGVFIGNNMGDKGQSLTTLLESMGPIGGPIVVAVLTGVISFMADMNPALSTAVSREGRGHDFMLGLPIPVKTHLMSKLAVGYGLSALGILITIAAVAILFPMIWQQALLACVLCLLFAYGCACLALARDVRKPRLTWVTEQEAVKQNFGTLISMLLGMGLLGILGGISYLLIAKLSFTTLAYFGVMAALLAVGAFLAHRHLIRTGERYYIAQ